MSNYFDNKNNQKNEWKVTDTNAKIVVDHGSHTHSLDLTNATAGQMLNDSNRTLGDAHRAASHDKK